jgi:hypothetical protein
MGQAPTKCDLCAKPLIAVFVDGRTIYGRWAIMCPDCRVLRGPDKLGTGLGQKFERKPGGPWTKTGG